MAKKHIPRTKPTRCVDPFPTNKTIWFAGEPIRIRVLSMYTGLGINHISRIFSGSRYERITTNDRKCRVPNLKTAIKLAEGLQMDLGPFLEALKEHQEIVERYGKLSDLPSTSI